MRESSSVAADNRDKNRLAKPPNQDVKRDEIGGEQQVGNSSPHEEADFQDLPCGNAIANDKAENNHAKRRKEKRAGWTDQVVQQERKDDSKGQRQSCPQSE